MCLVLGAKSTEIPLYTVPKETRIIGKKLVYIPECSSTNSEALRFTDEQGIQDGMVVICRHQFAGRGQAGNRWEAEPGKNLTFSVVLENPSDIDRQFHLNIAVSVALAQTIEKISGKQVQVKWPNDLIISGNKLGGILIENVLRGNKIRYSVIGIGLNINQGHFEIPNVTSLYLLSGINFDLNSLLADLLKELELFIDKLKSREFEWLKKEWLARLYLLNTPYYFKAGTETFLGMITGIDEVGKLEVMVDGRRRYFNFKEISFEHGLQ